MCMQLTLECHDFLVNEICIFLAWNYEKLSMKIWFEFWYIAIWYNIHYLFWWKSLNIVFDTFHVLHFLPSFCLDQVCSSFAGFKLNILKSWVFDRQFCFHLVSTHAFSSFKSLSTSLVPVFGKVCCCVSHISEIWSHSALKKYIFRLV